MPFSTTSSTRRASALCAAALLTLAHSSIVSRAQADDTPQDPKLEARERFGRGLRLFNDGDNAGALAEFERAHQLAPHPLVLFNIGLVHAAMGRAVEAVDALDRVLKDSGALGPERAERARTVRSDQAKRIAQLTVTSNVDGAAVELDNVKVGTTPLGRPLRVTSGTRLIGVVAPGYQPERRQISVGGEVKTTLAFELEPSAGRLGHVVIDTPIPEVEIWVDGKIVGRTPLATPVALAPGPHQLELRRAGYVTARRSITVAERSSGSVGLRPAVDRASLPATGGRLHLEISEPDATLSIDGERLGKYGGSVLLPSGAHVVLVERDGFDPVRREVRVAPSSTTTVNIDLIPTPEYRARYERKATLFRSWGWAGVVGGGVVAGASTGFLVWNAGEVRSAKDDFNAAADERDARTGEHCALTVDVNVCNQWVEAHFDILQEREDRAVYGWIGVGVGAATLVTGTVLLLTGDDPDRYAPERPELGRPRILPTVWATDRAGGVAAFGRF